MMLVGMMRVNILVPIHRGKTSIFYQRYAFAYLTYMQSTSYEMPSWMMHKLESRLPGEISVTLDMQMTPPLWQKVKRN